jgi:hypothetical protein
VTLNTVSPNLILVLFPLSRLYSHVRNHLVNELNILNYI